MDPEHAKALLTGNGAPAARRPDRRSGSSAYADGNGGIGLANVDHRLRAVYGPEYGLLLDTAPGAGTKATVRIPRYARGVLAQ